MDYRISINLSRFNEMRTIMDENPYTGQLEECIVIPVKRNGIAKTKWGMFFLNLYAKQVPNKGGKNVSHLVKRFLSDEELESLRNKGTRKIPMVGKLSEVMNYKNNE